MRTISGLCGAILAFILPACFAQAGQGPRNATIMIVRHAEKPAAGNQLNGEGDARAKAYASYFRASPPGGQAPDRLIATADTKKSSRPRLTLGPLSQSTGLPIDSRFRNENVNGLARDLARNGGGKTTLISWHQGQIPELITALGGTPAAFLPGGNWPNNVFNWTVLLKFDGEGQVIPGESRLVRQPNF
jgi:broad specificity phosphatase PhoE